MSLTDRCLTRLIEGTVRTKKAKKKQGTVRFKVRGTQILNVPYRTAILACRSTLPIVYTVRLW